MPDRYRSWPLRLRPQWARARWDPRTRMELWRLRLAEDAPDAGAAMSDGLTYARCGCVWSIGGDHHDPAEVEQCPAMHATWGSGHG